MTERTVSPLNLEHPTRKRRRRDKTRLFIEASFPEQLDPHVLYDTRDRLEKLGNIMVKWQARKITGNNAMFQIWSLFPNIAEKFWDKRKEILGVE